MKITLSPCRGLPGAPETTLCLAGEVLTVDGCAFDLSGLAEGDEATPQGAHPFIGTILREDGEILCTLRVSLGDDAAPEQPGSPWLVRAVDGPVSIPALRIAADSVVEDQE